VGRFVGISAFRTQHADAVLSAAGEFFTSRGCAAEPARPGPVADDELQVFPPVNGWVVVWWPYRSSPDLVVRAISASLGCVASRP
jgi:hypothetical protein